MDVSGKDLIDLAALPIAAILGYFMYLLSSRIVNEVIRFASNHMEHNTQAINELRWAIQELTTWLHDNKESRT